MTAFCLFEFSGTFANLLTSKGYNVICIDKRLGSDIFEFDYKKYNDVDIIISHPPCTEFAGSGARHWEKKDLETPEKLALAKSLVYKTLEIINYHKPRVWFLENPVGRIERCVPELRNYKKTLFNPCDYAGYINNPTKEAYSKKTIIWGKYKVPIKKYVKPVPYDDLELNPIFHPRDENGKKLGWHTEEAKKVRSKTPLGFATAFIECNLSGVPFYSLFDNYI